MFEFCRLVSAQTYSAMLEPDPQLFFGMGNHVVHVV